MENFIYKRKTELLFGKDQLNQLPTKIKQQGSRVLLTYGKESIKRIGLYDAITNLLKEHQIFFVELGGIKPNPEVDTVRQGVSLIKEHNLDFILAVGGGSVIDNSKHMAMALAANADIWDIVKDGSLMNRATDFVNIGVVLTISATGSEMNQGGVISNPETKEKLATGHPMVAPSFSFLDPSVLKTLPHKQRVAGVCDTLSHLLELYFDTHEDSGFADRIIEALFSNTVQYSQQYIHDSENYEASAQLMLSATYALNGVTGLGKPFGDWKTHGLEHELSAFTDFTHGIGLALIHPFVLQTYYKKDCDQHLPLTKFVNLGKAVFGLAGSDQEIAQSCVQSIQTLFFNLLDGPNLRAYGVDQFDFQAATHQLLERNNLNNKAYHGLTEEDILSIYQSIL